MPSAAAASGTEDHRRVMRGGGVEEGAPGQPPLQGAQQAGVRRVHGDRVGVGGRDAVVAVDVAAFTSPMADAASTGPMRATMAGAGGGSVTVWPPNDWPGVTVSRLVPSASISATSWARLELEMPRTATMVAMPSATPTADSTARAGRPRSPRTASGQTSARRSRLPGAQAGRPSRPRPRTGPHVAALSCSTSPSRSRIVRGTAVGDLRVVGDHDDRGARRRSARPAGARMLRALAPMSRLPVGSSARMIGGLARPGPGRWRPAGTRRRTARRAGGGPGGPGRPGSSASAAARRRSAAGIPRYSSPVATLSSVVSLGTRKNCWNTKPIRLARTPDRPRSGRSVDGVPGRPGPCPRSGVPACRRWPAASTCPIRMARRSPTNSPVADRER